MPQLFAVTRPLRQVPALLQFADRHNPLLWTRGDSGCVGIGEVLRLCFRGEDRFSAAVAAWREISARAVIDDPVNFPGSGLLAFGTFAFADSSAKESVLIVPRMLIARHGHRAWVTEISETQLTEPRPLPSPLPRGAWGGVSLLADAPDDAYLAGVTEAALRIDREEFAKVVLARSVTGTLAAADDLRVPLGRLSYRYENCWTYAVDGTIGASPETLVRQIGGQVSARVLAGTRGRSLDADTDTRKRDELLGSQKEQHEHAFAVQSVVKALSPFVRELRANEEPFPLPLPNVWHLATDIAAKSNGLSSSLELVAALHPSAAIAGTPTRKAVAAIAQLEPFDRERYAGATGWIDSRGDGEWVITLRCAQLGEPQAGTRSITAYAGGGIVEGSDPANEFRETVSKFRPIAEAFAP